HLRRGDQVRAGAGGRRRIRETTAGVLLAACARTDDAGAALRRRGARALVLRATARAARPPAPGRARRHRDGRAVDGHVRGLRTGHRRRRHHGARGHGDLRQPAHARQRVLARIRRRSRRRGQRRTMSDDARFARPAGARLVDVVSVQSQVAYGAVGNSIAVPVLQALGLHVAPVPTVLLGNTPHYPTMHGGPLPQDWFEGLLDDLEAREVATRARCVLVGYLGSPQQGLALARWLRRMREINPALVVQIDPVIGDHDTGSYTDPALLPV